LSGEAACLSRWMCGCLEAAGARSALKPEATDSGTDDRIITGEWLHDSGGNHFGFELDLNQARGCLKSKFGSTACESWPFEVHLLGSRETLSEAVFF